MDAEIPDAAHIGGSGSPLDVTIRHCDRCSFPRLRASWVPGAARPRLAGFCVVPAVVRIIWPGP
jgi:hypothetical protein